VEDFAFEGGLTFEFDHFWRTTGTDSADLSSNVSMSLPELGIEQEAAANEDLRQHRKFRLLHH